ncbi:YdgA family protein [Neisseriaceae bacterium B1]
MKKIAATGVAIIAVAGIFGATPYYLGGKAKESLDVQHRALADTFYFDVVSRDYQRGWLSSTETTVLRFHPAILAKLDKQLPENIKSLFNKPITMVNHVNHGLFANGIKPARAVVETEFQYDPEVQKTLARFFGDQVPVSARNVIKLDGSGDLAVKMSAFDYEELSGIKINWGGMNADVNYENGLASYATHIVMPSLKLQLADQGSLNAEGVDISMQSRDGKNDITLGSSHTKIARFDMAWSKDIAYDIRLNDLVNMVTDLQIGAFINPTGSVTPNKIALHNLSYQTQTDETSDNFINSEGTFAFDKLQYGDDAYGPLKINIAAEHLDSKALAALKQRWAQIATTQQSDNEAAQKLALDAVRNEGAGVFTNNPVFKIKAFDFTMPTGYIKVNGDFTFNGLQAADLNDFAAMVKKTRADINFDISQSLLEAFAVTQARSLFTVEDPNSAQEQQEISDTIKMLTNDTINTMTADGYLKKDNGAVQTRLVLENNRISLNGKAFEVQSSEDTFAELEAQVASEPESFRQEQAASAVAASVPATRVNTASVPTAASAP